jgi:enamine deaminase RidA (YjgF/YER057c/UK114 family)
MTLSDAGIARSSQDGLDLVTVAHGGVREVFATLLPVSGDDLSSLCLRTRQILDETGSEVLELRAFGAADAFDQLQEEVGRHLGPVDWPLSLVDGKSCTGQVLAGLQLHAVANAGVETHYLEGSPLGRLFESDQARYFVLGNVLPPDSNLSRPDQTRDTILRVEEGLASVGMDLHSIARTWFFVDDILAWYGDFNTARSEIYTNRGIFDRYVPASTGIGGSNAAGAAVMASVVAVEAKDDNVTVAEIPSPLQCPAGDYGSSFSRAAEMGTPEVRTLFVSGTASIDAEGATVHVDDVNAQIEQTFRVVKAILESRGMGFADVTRANAYFKSPADAGALEGHATRYGLPLSRTIASHDEICRDDLLFELEVDAVAP